MYKYIINSKSISINGTKNISTIYANSYTRATILANTLYPNKEIIIEKPKKSGTCPGCNDEINLNTKCSCWGYS